MDAETNANNGENGNTLAEKHVHYDDTSSQYVTDEVYWPLVDHLGSVRDVAVCAGGTTSVSNHLVYSAFGQILSETPGGPQLPFAFTGRELDRETDQYYYRARYYDVAVGKFLSEDPIGFQAGDANLSRYVGNAATGRTDPNGLAPCRGQVPRTFPLAGARFTELFLGKLEGVLKQTLASYLKSTAGTRGTFTQDPPRIWHITPEIEKLWINVPENEGILWPLVKLGMQKPKQTECDFAIDLNRSLSASGLLYRPPKGTLKFNDSKDSTITLTPLMHMTSRSGRSLSVGIDKVDHFVCEGLLLYNVYKKIYADGTNSNMKAHDADTRARLYAKSLACWFEGGLPANVPDQKLEEIFTWLTSENTKLHYNYCGIPIDDTPRVAYGMFADRNPDRDNKPIDPQGYASPADVHASLAGLDFYLWLEDETGKEGFLLGPEMHGFVAGGIVRRISPKGVELYIARLRIKMQQGDGDFPEIDERWDHNLFPNQLQTLPVEPGIGDFPKTLSDVPRIRLAE